MEHADIPVKFWTLEYGKFDVRDLRLLSERGVGVDYPRKGVWKAGCGGHVMTIMQENVELTGMYADHSLMPCL